jgi:hypothetical protein
MVIPLFVGGEYDELATLALWFPSGTRRFIAFILREAREIEVAVKPVS